MLSFPPRRAQGDNKQEEYSLLTAQDFSHGDVTRQEFKDEVDINVILKKFGVTQHGIQPMYIELDYDTDLQGALDTIAQAKAGHAALPDDLRKRYPDWWTLLRAMDEGKVEIKPKPVDTPETPEETPNT